MTGRRVAQAQAIAGAVADKLARQTERLRVIFERDAAGRVNFGGRPSQG